MNVYLYQNNTEKILKNAYIGEVWTPWDNTVAYYKFDWDTKDYSWNWLDLTAYNITYNTIASWNSCAYFNWASAYALNTTIDKTLSWWTQNIRVKKYRNNSDEVICQIAITPQWQITWDWWWIIRSTSTQTGNISHTLYYNNFVFEAVNNTWIANWTWMNVVAVAWSSGNKLYINWQQVTATYNYWNSSTSFWSIRFNRLSAWRHQHVSAQYAQCELSNRILENREWTAKEVQDYYNLTKSNYWL